METPPDYRGPKALAQEREYGAPIQGRLVETRHRVVEFPAQAWHGTCPWKGDKWTLTAYTSRREALLGDQEHDSLRTHGFPVQHQIPQQQALANEAGQPSSPSRNRREQDERIKRQLYLLHAATGHGSVKHLVEALRRRGVSERTLELAKEFQCSVCLERRRIGSRPLATLEPLPPKLSTVSATLVIGPTHILGKQPSFFLLLTKDPGSGWPEFSQKGSSKLLVRRRVFSTFRKVGVSTSATPECYGWIRRAHFGVMLWKPSVTNTKSTWK